MRDAINSFCKIYLNGKAEIPEAESKEKHGVWDPMLE
jgi:hypothetical protein